MRSVLLKKCNHTEKENEKPRRVAENAFFGFMFPLFDKLTVKYLCVTDSICHPITHLVLKSEFVYKNLKPSAQINFISAFSNFPNNPV